MALEKVQPDQLNESTRLLLLSVGVFVPLFLRFFSPIPKQQRITSPRTRLLPPWTRTTKKGDALTSWLSRLIIP